MKRRHILAAALMAGVFAAPVPKFMTGGPARIVDANTRGAQRETPPLPASVSSASAYTLSNFTGGMTGYSVRLNPIWPHNRPLPGWRAVQSRRRHRERMRRQRRNA